MTIFPPMHDGKGSVVKRIFLCRHGETEANATGMMQGSGIDLPLNDKGIAQAEALRNQLSNEKVDLLISSKLKVLGSEQSEHVKLQ
jgi:bisphosphoglycerate-dependent phosphoglycerate mutase